MEGSFIGQLHDHDPLSFSYSQDCLEGKLISPFADIIPVSTGNISTPEVMAYFENLLPEGDQRQALTDKLHVSSVFGLLAQSGWDTAGALELLPHGTRPNPPKYLKTSWDEIAKMIDGDYTLPNESLKTTISGAQFKVLLSIDPKDGSPLLPIEASISTHILKPDIQRTGQKIWSSAMNETLIMKTALKCGLPTAKVRYMDSVKSCLVERYDRIMDLDGVTKLNQFDMCQLMKVPSNIKYELDGGPSFSNCYALVKKISSNPIKDCESVVKWLFFNLLTGNNDSHAKNLSMLNSNNQYHLAPFYDLMCTSVYPGFSKNFAFQIGDTYEPNKIGMKELRILARSIQVSEKYLLMVAQELALKIPLAFSEAIDELKDSVSHNELVMAERIKFEVQSICKKRLQQFST